MNSIMALGLRKLDCELCEFLQHTPSNFDSELGVNYHNTLSVCVMVSCGEFLQRTLSNFDNELQ